MKIVFYSTNSNIFNSDTFHINTFPTVTSLFDSFCDSHKDNQFFVVTQKPCFFVPETGNDNITILSQDSSIKDVASFIISLTPDVAISLSYWVDPFDWLTINDSLVAEILNNNGIKTINHTVDSGMICFDKTKTHEKLKALGFKTPKYVLVDHDMYFCAGSNKKVIHNVYRDYISNEIKKLTLPLIIKDTVGVSSYGATVVHTYGEAIGYLNSKRNNSDRIVEEYISGQQFGLEVYGSKGNYSVMPPIRFSLNQYGITSPKLSVKYGPITDYNYDTEALYDMILKVCDYLSFNGVAQFDLVYKDRQWYIIEINPRLSGMTYTYSNLLGKTIYDIIFDTCILHKEIKVLDKKVLNIKLPVLPLNICENLYKISGVSFVHLTNDEMARQEREKGYCEIIIVGYNISDLKDSLLMVENLLDKEDFSTINSFVKTLN